MADLDDFFYVDGVDDVLAAHTNNLLAATLRAEYRNAETLSADRALLDGDTPIQVLTPDAANRAITLPAADDDNHAFHIVNASSVYSLTFADFESIPPNGSAIFAPTGAGWRVYRREGATSYRIAVSVTSNNLTVALKNSAGDDPSVSAPVRVIIGDTVREITAALSVTANAGTNWCNSGSTALAARLVQYFTYLGYNATDGVTLGFARVPWIRKYSEFSTTSTDETYAKISTITNAAAGDDYTVIGRFSATLSAGAGYTWSISGTGDPVHRPIYETDVLTWLPALSASGSMTATLTTVSMADYYVSGRDFCYNVQTIFETGGTAGLTVFCTIPFIGRNAANQPALPAWVIADSLAEVSFAYVDNVAARRIAFRRTGSTNWALAADKYANSSGRIIIAS